MSLFKWQMYAAQGMRNKWYSFLGEDMMEESDEDQDSLKVIILFLREAQLLQVSRIVGRVATPPGKMTVALENLRRSWNFVIKIK